MNLIFLDVDGVLNSTRKLIEVYNKTHRPHSCYEYPFDENCLKNLKFLVEKTNSKIVVTSTWRKDEEGRSRLLEELKKYDLDKYVIGYTKILSGKKVKEIKEYLSHYEIYPNFIILDNIKAMEDLTCYLINTDTYVGLTYENVEEGIKKLTKKI